MSPRRETLLIIGNGMVGQRLCEQLAEQGARERYRIVVLGEEEVPAYDRVHLTDIWRGRAPGELQLRELSWYQAQGIELKLGSRAERIDREARQVTTEDGAAIEYDKLVLATGSKPVALRVPLEDGVQVLPYRTLSDARLIYERAQARKRLEAPIAVIGGGLLGVEAARSLQELGCRVVLLESASQLLPRQLDPAAAKELERLLRNAGLELRLRATISSIRHSEPGVRLELSGDAALDASFAVCAVGARAKDELAQAAALRCHVRGGVLVDSSMRTTDPRVFAIGECAAFEGVPHGLVAPGYAMADVLAQTLTGHRSRLGPQQAITRLKLDLTEVTVLGDPLQANTGPDRVYQAEGRYRRLVVRKDRVIAAVCVGAWEDLGPLQEVVARGRRLSRGKLEQFERNGALELLPRRRAMSEWSDTTVVCQCANVSCGVLRRHLKAGASSPDSLARATSASTLCGSCRPLLEELCGAPALSSKPFERERVLGIAAIIALVMAILTLATPTIPAARSITQQTVDVLWFDPFWKQVTGFTLLALSSLGFLLSLRKRSKRFKFGSYSKWRAAHSLFGVAGLVALFAHTGLRLGSQLNLILMLAFLASVITGALSGLLVVLAAGNERFQRVVTGTKRLHDFAFWPLPVLAGFHMFKTYYY